MAVLIQYRQLRQRVDQQLKERNDEEKNSQSPSRLSRCSTLMQAEHVEKSFDDVNQNVDGKIPMKLDLSYSSIPGISLQKDRHGSLYYQVGWESSSDPQNPRNWPTRARLGLTLLLIATAYTAGSTISMDAAVSLQAAQAFQVSQVVEVLSSTGIVLIGLGIGCLLTAPASELLGRYPVYLGAMIIFACWIIGAALSPNIAARTIFRFLAGVFCSAPLTVPGGSISDVWTTREKTWTFPLYGIFGFASTVLGPVIASYVGQSPRLSWRWAEWITLISTGLVILLIIATMRETLPHKLLRYKAAQFRRQTGDDRFKSASEAAFPGVRLTLKKTFSRPFVLMLEPIVFLLTLYTSVVYIVLFMFLVGYSHIFHEVYGISQSETNLCFLGLVVGILLGLIIVPVVNGVCERKQGHVGSNNRENRLLYAMIGAPCLPIGLFWMAWTDYAHISIWSPLFASVSIAFSAICIWLSTFMYIVDCYETYAASAMTFVSVVRYVAAGAMVVVAVPMYQNLGTHWTLTILGGISAAITPIPYVFYVWGNRIRARSKYIVRS